jgi:excisionase family DNA binding protein
VSEALERKTWSVREAAEMAGIGKDKMLQLIKDGQAPGRKLGRRVLIPKGAFAEWLESYLRGDYGKAS